MTRLAFFPTPYPDEVLYSVLCRYHVRSGNPGANTSIKELWGRKDVAKSLYLPNGLDSIIDRLPDGTGITVDSLIWNHTMYPYVKPKLTKERADLLYSMLCGSEKEHTHTYPKAGLLYGRPSLPQYLRFCPACVESDIEKYGEAYWHRLHQLPGVSICPVHDEYISDSPFFIHMIFRYFFPAAAELCEGIAKEKPFSPETRAHHIAFAEDSTWILENGTRLGTMEDLCEKYSRLLEFKGYRGHMPDTAQYDYRGLNQAIHAFYGQEFLSSLSLYDEDDYSSWPACFSRKSITNPSTAQQLLMMRFLASSPRQFADSNERFMPFGEPPWPCRNKICDYHLKDCIEKIEILNVKGFHRATFTCPHCGFSYRRGKATPKDLQYEGYIRTVEFGWLWRQRLKECLADREMSVHQTVLEMGYPDTTIRKHAVQMGLLPECRMPPIKHGFKKVARSKMVPESPESRRERWLRLVSDNPDMKRSALGRKDFDNYKWMLANDYEWFNAHSPAPRIGHVDWARRDREYLDKVMQAVAEIQTQPGRPRWLCYSSIANQAAIGNKVYQMLGKLPETKNYLDSVVETRTEWRQRKIRWAIQQLYSSGQVVSYDKVRLTSGISTRISRTLREYIEQEIQNMGDADNI